MRASRVIAPAALLVLALTVWLWWRQSSKPEPVSLPEPAVATNPSAAPTAEPPIQVTPTNASRGHADGVIASNDNAKLPPAGWSKRRDDILVADASPAEKAAQLLALLPRLEPPDQEEAAQHLANLLPDERFATAGAYLTNVAAPESVRGPLVRELWNRPDSVKLPLCVVLAATPEHPQAEAARELLVRHAGTDYGTNWPAWDAAVRQLLEPRK